LFIALNEAESPQTTLRQLILSPTFLLTGQPILRATPWKSAGNLRQQWIWKHVGFTIQLASLLVRRDLHA
jgi:hypothetical protein